MRASPRGRGRRSSSTADALLLDLFKRIPKRYQNQSTLGGVLTAVCAVVLTVLVMLETQSYLSVTYRSEVVFTGNRENFNPFVSLRFNVTFPHLPCKFLSAEVFDVYGRHALNDTTSSNMDIKIYKWRVVDEGQRRVGAMEEHKEPNEAGVHEEIPYHDPAHQFREVTPLTTGDFDDFIKSKDVVLVDFYAPWCIWCQRLAPVWEKFAHQVGNKDYSDFVGIAKVDCTAETKLCRRRKITAYPSIFLYRDKNPNLHIPYEGPRTTTAFLSFIEGLSVEADHTREVIETQEQVKSELHAERRKRDLAAAKKRPMRIDEGINHPLKHLTAPGKQLGPGSIGNFMAIMRAMEHSGGARSGGVIRLLGGRGGAIRIISVRSIPSNGAKKQQPSKRIPLQFNSKPHGDAAKPSDAAGDDEEPKITVKVLPKASDKAKAAEKTANAGNSKKAGDSGNVVAKAAEVQTAAKAAADADGNAAPADPAGGGGKRRRRLLSVEEEGRIPQSELESRAELFKLSDHQKRQQIWKEFVLPLPEAQQRVFADLVGGKIMSSENLVDQEKSDVSEQEKEAAKVRAPKDAHPHHVHHTEGCLIYGAIAAEKVPATIRFKAKSMWHDFASHHIDMSHSVHDFTFGDLTHQLQTEFAHVNFHEYDGTKMMTSLAPKTFKSTSTKQTHHHYLRVVPTHVNLLGMDRAVTEGDELFQYTATSNQYHDTEHVPSVKFTFDFDPMTLQLREEGVPFHKFFTSICAIIGGVVVVFTMLNSALQTALEMVTKKRH